MIDRASDMRHILSQIALVTGGTVMESPQDSPAARMIADINAQALPARVTLHALSNTAVEATDLEAPNPGNGQGRMTMKAILDAADRHGVTVEVWPVWDGDVEGGLHQDQLREWYLRLGFERIPNRDPDDDVFEYDRYLVRKPRSAVAP